MISYQGNAHNINAPILGQVAKNKGGLLFKKDRILVTEKVNWRCLFYTGIITCERPRITNLFSRIPIVSGIEFKDCIALKDGDIVLLEPSGKVNVVWQIGSPHNCILTTEECNCNCIMCPQPPNKDPEHMFEFNMKLISLLDPGKTDELCITGGEPTLLGDRLFSIIEACKDRFPKASVTLLTNGIRFKDFEFCRTLAEINHPNLIICVSLYADDDTEHDLITGRNGSFYETIKGLDNLALFRQKIEIRTVISALNYKRLPRFAEFIYRNFPFVIHVAFMGLEITGLAHKNLNIVWIDPVEYIAQLKSAVLYLNRWAINVSIYNLQLCILPKEIRRFCRKSISSWKNIYLTQCYECDLREECGGFFATSENIYSKYIHPFKKA